MKIWIDGSGWNGKVSRCCVCFEDGDVRKTTIDGERTNNEMEYKALLESLVCLLEKPTKEFEIFTDSQLVHGQVCKNWKITKDHLFTLNRAVKDQLKRLEDIGYNIKITWIPRNENKAGGLLE